VRTVVEDKIFASWAFHPNNRATDAQGNKTIECKAFFTNSTADLHNG